MRLASLPGAALAVSLSCVAATAQIGTSNNAPLLARFDPGASYNDIWGYVDPSTGGEYAILCSTSGTYIVDCTDPSNPVQRAFFSGPSSSWRDARTYDRYAYVVTEGGGGMQIIDLSDPDSPSLVRTWGTNFWSNSHNVAIDTGAGVLYACGTNSGTDIVDLTGNPENPSLIGNYFAAYVHDLHVQDGWAHLGEINSSRYRILDVSNPASWNILGGAPVSSCHNVWPTRDNNFAVTTSEQTNGALRFFDITDKNNPQQLATWATGSSTSVHNVFVRDRVAHAAYYAEGYRALDMSDPANPVEVAFYDTSSSNSGFNGAWGCYPFMPSGNVYVSDRSNGLHIFDSAPTARQYGTGTSGASGMPRIYPFGAAYAGNQTFAMQVEDAAPNATAWLVISTAEDSISVSGLGLLVDLAVPNLVVATSTDSAGSAKIDMPLGASLPNVSLYMQFLVNDVTGPLQLTASNGVEIEFFDL